MLLILYNNNANKLHAIRSSSIHSWGIIHDRKTHNILYCNIILSADLFFLGGGSPIISLFTNSKHINNNNNNNAVGTRTLADVVWRSVVTTCGLWVYGNINILLLAIITIGIYTYVYIYCTRCIIFILP